MSTWRRKAISCLPELKKDFEDAETSIYGVFLEMLPALIEAHKQNDTDRLENIYNYAEWCFKQKEEDLWNAAGVAFYEHLGDYEETRNEMPKWVKYEIYKQIRGLLELRIAKDTLLELDKRFRTP
jgi:hypothetical protein